MYYWRQGIFGSLKHAASSANALENWPQYAQFCLEYEQGLRKQAFSTLHEFIFKMEREPFAERRRFVSWLLTIAEGSDGRQQLIPNPLQIKIIEPTLLEWTQEEPLCAEPHRWLGDREHLEQALELDPKDHIARMRLIIQIMRYISYTTHHLPTIYLGAATEDLALVERVEGLLKGINDDIDRASLAEFVSEEKAAIQEYLRRT